MKTTIDLPDDLYRAVKARAALEGRTVRDVTVDLYRRWLGELMQGSGTEPGADLRAWVRTSLAPGAPGVPATRRSPDLR